MVLEGLYQLLLPFLCGFNVGFMGFYRTRTILSRCVVSSAHLPQKSVVSLLP